MKWKNLFVFLVCFCFFNLFYTLILIKIKAHMSSFLIYHTSMHFFHLTQIFWSAFLKKILFFVFLFQCFSQNFICLWFYFYVIHALWIMLLNFEVLSFTKSLVWHSRRNQKSFIIIYVLHLLANMIGFYMI